MKNFIKRNKWFLLISIVLFFVPFFWFEKGKIDIGGDSTRFYFVDPYSWLTNIALYFINPLKSLGEELPNFLMVPFLGLLIIIKTIVGGSSYNLNNIFNGFLLSGSFLSMCLISRDLLDYDSDSESALLPSIISGLFFILSPLIIYDWERALNAIHQIFVYPLIFLLLLRYVKTGKIFYILFVPIFTFVFAVNFSIGTVPWMFAYFPFAFLFLFFYSLITKNVPRFFKGLIISGILFLFLNSFDIIPQFFNSINPSGSNFKMIFDPATRGDWGIPYFQSIANHVRLLYNWTNQPQYVITYGFDHMTKTMIKNYGIKFILLFFSYPLTVCLGMIFKNKFLSENGKRFMNALSVFFLITTYFMTANITVLGQNIYRTLFYLPGFSMFRSFYGKFALVYLFFYSIFLAYSLLVIFKLLKPKVKIIVFLFFVAIITLNGWPLLSGQVVNGKLWRSKNVGFASETDPDYFNFSEVLKNEKINAKVLSLPLADENYQLLQGKSEGAYFGPSTITILSGKNSFNGVKGFTTFWPQVQDLIEKKKYLQLNKLLGFFNIGYAFHNNDDYIYENFPDYPYNEWLKTLFPDQKSMENFLGELNFEKTYSIGRYNLFLKNSNFLPHFFIPKEIVNTNDNVDVISDILDFNDYDIRTAVNLDSISQRISSKLITPNNSNETFIAKGITKDISYLALYEGSVGEGIFYPFVNNKPAFIWLLKILNEQYEENLHKDNILEFVARKIYYANKRVNELYFKGNEQTKLLSYKNKIREEIYTAKTVEDDDKRMKLFYQIMNNLKDNSERVKIYIPANFDQWMVVIGNYINEMDSLVKKFDPFVRNYSLDIPSSGNYDIFLKENKEKFNYELENLLLTSNVEINGKVIDSSQNIEKRSDGWIKYSDVFLEKRKNNLRMLFSNFPDLSKTLAWQSYIPSAEQQEDLYLRVAGFEFPKAIKYVYADIPGWDKDEWYLIEGKINTNQKLKMVIGDNYQDWAEGMFNKKKKDFYLTDKKIDLSPENEYFRIFIKSQKKTVGGKIFLYPTERNIASPEDALIKVEDLKISRMPSLNIVLRIKKENQVNYSPPKITFVKINPTKYRIKITGANSPFNFVFSENFHNGWKLFSTENEQKYGLKTALIENIQKVARLFTEDTTYGRVVASYFDGDIKEGEHQIKFIEPSTFENWAKKPIADDKHYVINGYANCWYISPSDFNNKKDFEFMVEFTPQRFFYVGLFITSISFITTIILLIIYIFKGRKANA